MSSALDRAKAIVDPVVARHRGCEGGHCCGEEVVAVNAHDLIWLVNVSMAATNIIEAHAKGLYGGPLGPMLTSLLETAVRGLNEESGEDLGASPERGADA